jgi:hypothetical protein
LDYLPDIEQFFGSPGGQFWSGIFGGVVSSLLFIGLLRILLSPRIKLHERFQIDNGLVKFKITNVSWRQVINLQYSAHRIEPQASGRFKSTKTHRIELFTQSNVRLERRPWWENRTDYYNIVSSKKDDLQENLRKWFADGSDRRIRLRVMATDPYSQITKVFTRYYDLASATSDSLLNASHDLDG